jgi:hypothetical protein
MNFYLVVGLVCLAIAAPWMVWALPLTPRQLHDRYVAGRPPLPMPVMFLLWLGCALCSWGFYLLWRA